MCRKLLREEGNLPKLRKGEGSSPSRGLRGLETAQSALLDQRRMRGAPDVPLVSHGWVTNVRIHPASRASRPRVRAGSFAPDTRAQQKVVHP